MHLCTNCFSCILCYFKLDFTETQLVDHRGSVLEASRIAISGCKGIYYPVSISYEVWHSQWAYLLHSRCPNNKQMIQILEILVVGTGKMAQWLRTLSALLEDLALIPNLHTAIHKHL